jgi:hypothetical protein
LRSDDAALQHAEAPGPGQENLDWFAVCEPKPLEQQFNRPMDGVFFVMGGHT